MHNMEKPTGVSLEKEVSSPKKASKTNVVALALALGLLMVAVIFGVNNTNKKSEEVIDYGDKLGAQVACEDAVKKETASPDTVQFTNPQVQQNTRKPQEYQVIGFAKSENLPGGMEGESYKCDVTYIAESKEWVVEITPRK